MGTCTHWAWSCPYLIQPRSSFAQDHTRRARSRYASKLDWRLFVPLQLCEKHLLRQCYQWDFRVRVIWLPAQCTIQAHSQRFFHFTHTRQIHCSKRNAKRNERNSPSLAAQKPGSAGIPNLSYPVSKWFIRFLLWSVYNQSGPCMNRTRTRMSDSLRNISHEFTLSHNLRH